MTFRSDIIIKSSLPALKHLIALLFFILFFFFNLFIHFLGKEGNVTTIKGKRAARTDAEDRHWSMSSLVPGNPGLRNKKVGTPKDRDRTPKTSFHSE